MLPNSSFELLSRPNVGAEWSKRSSWLLVGKEVMTFETALVIDGCEPHAFHITRLSGPGEGIKIVSQCQPTESGAGEKWCPPARCFFLRLRTPPPWRQQHRTWAGQSSPGCDPKADREVRSSTEGVEINEIKYEHNSAKSHRSRLSCAGCGHT